MGRPAERGQVGETGRNVSKFQLSHLFPEFNGERKPLPKQGEVLGHIQSGGVTGGGVVYQGGKGSGKTIVGSAALIWAHHVPKWKGLRSLIGRESYPSLLTSTADEFFKMVDSLPARMVSGYSRPTKNAMGWVEWGVGGLTMLCSLSNSDTWESANLGLAWVDEAHRQNQRIIGDLETRLRQQNAPRTMILTTNPGGKGWMYKMAHPDSRFTRRSWKWIEATTLENPTLPEDYNQRLIDRYGVNTPAFKRWVLGQSAALEGTVFTEFVPDVEHCIHVVPACDLPQEWRVGRGLDYGMVSPTAVVWAALSPEGDWWVDMVHYAPAEPEEREFWTIEKHAEAIKDIDARYKSIDFVPADPSIFARIHTSTVTGSLYSTADEFYNHGIDLSRADNDRESGLSILLDLMALDSDRCHPVSLELGSPKLFILDRECNEPLIEELSGLLWAKPEGTLEIGRPDDVQKKNDHGYDALRYLVKDAPSAYAKKETVRYRRPDQVVGSRGRTRSY